MEAPPKSNGKRDILVAGPFGHSQHVADLADGTGEHQPHPSPPVRRQPGHGAVPTSARTRPIRARTSPRLAMCQPTPARPSAWVSANALVLGNCGWEGPASGRVMLARLTDRGLGVLRRASRTYLHGIKEHFTGRLSQAQLRSVAAALETVTGPHQPQRAACDRRANLRPVAPHQPLPRFG
jgi:hypothetical protein